MTHDEIPPPPRHRLTDSVPPRAKTIAQWVVPLMTMTLGFLVNDWTSKSEQLREMQTAIALLAQQVQQQDRRIEELERRGRR